jgi:hypothetical protein
VHVPAQGLESRVQGPAGSRFWGLGFRFLLRQACAREDQKVDAGHKRSGRDKTRLRPACAQEDRKAAGGWDGEEGWRGQRGDQRDGEANGSAMSLRGGCEGNSEDDADKGDGGRDVKGSYSCEKLDTGEGDAEMGQNQSGVGGGEDCEMAGERDEGEVSRHRRDEGESVGIENEKSEGGGAMDVNGEDADCMNEVVREEQHKEDVEEERKSVEEQDGSEESKQLEGDREKRLRGGVRTGREGEREQGAEDGEVETVLEEELVQVYDDLLLLLARSVEWWSCSTGDGSREEGVPNVE